MAHPLANDPVMGRFFAKVTHMVVRAYEDGYEWSYNLNALQTPKRDEILAKEQARVGDYVDPIHGVLTNVYLEEVN